jgi:hypothetical protein
MNEQVENVSVPTHKKKFKAFWPIVIIFIIAAVAAGLVINSSYNSVIQDELNSLIFKTNRK